MRVLCCIGFLLLAPPVAAQADMQLPANTRVPIVTTTTLSSATAKKGTHFTMAVDSDVTVFGVPLIAKGAPVWGTITDAEPAGRFGHGGRLVVMVDSVQAVDSQNLKLTGSAPAQAPGQQKAAPNGNSVQGQAVSQATSIVTSQVNSVLGGFAPAAGFFRHGENVVYKAGVHFSMATTVDTVIHVPDRYLKKTTPTASDSTVPPPDSSTHVPPPPHAAMPSKDSTTR